MTHLEEMARRFGANERHRILRCMAIGAGGLVAATAVAGGLELILGWPVRQPLEWLAPTPFDSYVVPGALLAGVVGGSTSLATVAAIRRTPRWPLLVAAAGLVLTAWIVGEVALLDQPGAPTATEWLYGAVGLLLVATGVGAKHATR